MALYNKPNGNLFEGSQVKYNLNSSCIGYSGVNKSKSSYMNLRPK